MTFWLGVAVVYVALAGVGLALGRYFANRYPGRDNGGGLRGADPSPPPTGPSHALECPPLGSAFDRALLPGVFTDDPALSGSRSE